MTAQIPDRISFDGHSWQLMAEPLNRLLSEITRPELHAPHTACWRGYQARWSVEAGTLWLVDVIGYGPTGEELDPSVLLGGLSLPLEARWVTATMRLARGDLVRHVHADYESRFSIEYALHVEGGDVLRAERLAQPGQLGSAGPYELDVGLLGDLSGGAFGQLVLGRDVAGNEIVAKLARHRSLINATEMFRDTGEGRQPVHVPAVALREGDDGTRFAVDVGQALVIEALLAEAELLQRDGGQLLPFSFGMWEHQPSGTPTLVMERLQGRPPSTPGDVRSLLAALNEAVLRGTFTHHGDVKYEHVFIADDGTVRMCDPAARFTDPSVRSYTPLYNPAGRLGPASDIAACATLLRYLPGSDGQGWRWCSAVLDDSSPPAWANDHAAALAALDDELSAGEVPPAGWQPPPIPSRLVGVAPAPPLAPQSLSTASPLTTPSYTVNVPAEPSLTVAGLVERVVADIVTLRTHPSLEVDGYAHVAGEMAPLFAAVADLRSALDACAAHGRADPASGSGATGRDLPPDPAGRSWARRHRGRLGQLDQLRWGKRLDRRRRGALPQLGGTGVPRRRRQDPYPPVGPAGETYPHDHLVEMATRWPFAVDRREPARARSGTRL